MSRHLIANLEWEHELARAATPRPGALAPLPGHVLTTITTAAALLRVLLDDDDTLWTPAPLDPARLPEVPGLAQPRLATGIPGPCRAPPRRDLDPDAAPSVGARPRVPPPLDDITAVLAWGETATIARLRPPPTPAARRDDEASLAARLWSCEPPSPEVAARVQHRGHTLHIARCLGCALPGAACVHDVATLCAALPSGPWILKVPWSSAGRERIRGAGCSLDPTTLTRIEKLLALHGELILEPWRERVEDLGVAGIIEEAGVQLLGVHRQHVDADGRFLAIHVDTARPAGRDHELLLSVAQAVGERLAAAGQRGPFGIDAWRERTPDGRVTLHPLGEVNARLTFGHVAHAYREWAGAPAVELAVSARRAPPADDRRRVPLVLDTDGRAAAWLVV